MQIFDVSLALSDKTIVYPDNVGVSIEPHHRMPEFSSHLSKIIIGSHTGTHVDAPSHVFVGAHSLDQIPLETFVGQCRVLDMTTANESVTVADFAPHNITKGERILIKTKNSARGFSQFYDDYVYLDGDAADYLAEREITLIGIDYISIKKRKGADNRPHTSLLSKNIPIIEGLDLHEVTAGAYWLVCLPLKCIGIEGAPARAILVQQ